MITTRTFLLSNFTPSSLINILLLLSLSSLHLIQTVTGDESYAIRTLLNHGTTLPTGQTCTINEWDIVTSAMDNAGASINRRIKNKQQRTLFLRHRIEKDDNVDVENHERLLQMQSPNYNNHHHRQLRYFCTTMCQAYPPNTCHIVYKVCRNDHRNRYLIDNNNTGEEQEANGDNKFLEEEGKKQEELLEQEQHISRELLVHNAICQMKIGAINAALDNLVANPTTILSNDCKAVINTYREFDCYEVHTISGWNLWDATYNTISIPSFPELGIICNTFKFNIEAIIPDYYDNNISFVTFIITGPNGYKKLHIGQQHFNNKKWFIFGNNGDTNIFGEILSTPGTYTVTATPNGDISMERSLSFTIVDDC